jgi:CRP/FNR family transcriptional regulator, cyclic AMP receptor protein
MVNLGLFRHAETLSITAGTTIFEEGDLGETMYVVIEGQIEINVGPVTVEMAGPGSIVGEMALIDKSPRSATAKARTDCKVAAVDAKRFEFLVQHTPYFSIQVMQIMADRLRHSNTQLQNANATSLPVI